ncbi:type II toxin-antitoxin system VapC family toxin [Aestuariimicrobium ganziense]|uniref:type II toxin-antitoxin system VapC family toxin n=1 Tax=Aestuariimicrobium ganziense TaxID=2773677 RepID=UPI0019436966|nr:type II toxin-antitoxin system VapC family toxin [Aestuariimicrobium ganziense]
MTVLDSSSLVAVLLGEPDAERHLDAMIRSETLCIGAPTLLEAQLVLLHRAGDEAVRDLHALLADLICDVVAFDEVMSTTAAVAHARFGKGRHPAGLNFGDALAYAVAKDRGEPLLFKGDDFPQTDITAALV